MPSYVARGGALSIREKIYSSWNSTTTRIAAGRAASPVPTVEPSGYCFGVTVNVVTVNVASSARNLSTAAAW